METVLHLNFRRKTYFSAVFHSSDWSCPLRNGKVTLLTSTEQLQPLTLPGFCSGQEVVFPLGQIWFPCLNLVRSWGTKSVALIQSAPKRRQLSKEHRWRQVTAGDTLIISRRTNRLWSLVMLLWATPNLPLQIQFGAKLWLPSEYGVPFYS